jgi:hypothetical protein
MLLTVSLKRKKLWFMFFNLSSVVSKDESRVGGGELWRRGGAAEEEFCRREDREGKSSSVTIPRVRES